MMIRDLPKFGRVYCRVRFSGRSVPIGPLSQECALRSREPSSALRTSIPSRSRVARTASRLGLGDRPRCGGGYSRTLATLVIFAVVVPGARADVHAPVAFSQTLLSARSVFNTEGRGDDDARVDPRRRLVENDPRYGTAVRRVLLEGARDSPSEGGGEGAGTRDESGVVSPPRHGPDAPRRRGGVGVARLARRAVDAEDELAAEANGTKPRLTSPRSWPRVGHGASPKHASSTRDAGDDRPKIPTTDGPERKILDPRWRLLLDDDDDDDVVKPGDLEPTRPPRRPRSSSSSPTDARASRHSWPTRSPRTAEPSARSSRRSRGPRSAAHAPRTPRPRCRE